MTGRGPETSSWRAWLLLGSAIVVGGLVVVGLPLSGVPPAPTGTTTSTAGASPTDQPPLTSTTVRGTSRIPVRLAIPAIGVAGPLVDLGLQADRTVEVPADPDLAGWFRRGPAPGRPGSAVILGHVDSPAGPAVFARLQELRPGDSVIVDLASGRSVRFLVERSALYANDDFPARRVYAARGAHRLNLVTCGGAYDSARGGYQSNLVVYTQRVRAATAG